MIAKIKRFPKFLKEVHAELGKVSWSKRDELVFATIMVLIVSGILTTYIALVDLGFSKALQFFLR